MRKIFFRAKSIEDLKWIYGSLVITCTSRYFICNGLEIAVIPETVGQLTCMAGKDAKLIFEGDLVHIDDGSAWRSSDNPKNIGVVVYGKGGYFVNGTYTQYDVYAWLHSIEVIGNVHDNPELLPKTKNLKSEAYVNGEYYCAEKAKGVHTCRRQCFSCESKGLDGADLNVEAEESKEK